MPTAEIQFNATSLQRTRADRPQLLHLAGSHTQTPALAFAQSTEQFVDGMLKLPASLDASGNVTFRAHVRTASDGSDRNVALTFAHAAIDVGETYDTAKTDDDSGDLAVDDTAINLTELTWSQSVATLGWAANDLLAFTLSRPPASSANLADDLYLFTFTIELPLS